MQEIEKLLEWQRKITAAKRVLAELEDAAEKDLVLTRWKYGLVSTFGVQSTIAFLREYQKDADLALANLIPTGNGELDFRHLKPMNFKDGMNMIFGDKNE